MKILILVEDQMNENQNELYSNLHKTIGSVDLRRLNKNQQTNLKQYYQNIETKDKFDRILIALDFDLIRGQSRFLETLPGLIIYDWQAAFPVDEAHHDVSYKQRFRFYKTMPWVRIIVASSFVYEIFIDAGLDAYFLPRGFHSKNYIPAEEPITKKPLGICISSLDSEYRKNINFLAKVKHYNENVFEITRNGDHYNDNVILNTIDKIICADYSFRSYPSEVYEAMASGCLVFALNKGRKANEALGFIPMKNIVLFSSFKDFKEKYELLLNDESRAAKIIQAGIELMHSKFQLAQLGKHLAHLLEEPVRDPLEFSSGIRVFGFKL